MKLTKTHVAIAILIILGAIFANYSLSTWPSGTTSDTVKCGGGWTNIGYGASALAKSCGSSYTVLDFRMPWGEELNGVKVYERSLKTFVNPNDDTEWLYVWAIGCSSSGTYFVVNYGPPDLCANVETPNICDGFNLYSQKCVDGNLVKENIIEENSIECGCIVQEPVNTCIGFDLWSQKQSTICIEGLEKDQLLEEKSIECGYVCTDGETKSFKCTDNTIIVTQLCSNNEWEDTEHKSCPLNWTNLEMILRGYINDIKTYLEKIL